MRNVAQELARSTYHQNFYDQVLGPSVGRVVNDVVAEMGEATMTPQDAAKAVQAAWKQGNERMSAGPALRSVGMMSQG